MKYYVRKIALNKFPKPPETSYEISSIRADAVSDLKTTSDKLSIWEIESTSEASINKAVLALVTSSKQQRFDDLDIVVFSEDDIATKGLSVESEEGDTAIAELRNTHRNITSLTYESLASVLTIISDITITGCHIRKRRQEIETLIRDNSKKIDVESFINDDIKTKIRKLAGISV
ncbi:MAG: hypothetical protein FWC62_05410 [Firmicutes bacterium]|nr:hypothetical protein [Bacillota bacterium]